MEQTKDKIIACAFELFAGKGYASTSMDDIVRVSGISKGGIYHHFKSKEEIFLAIAQDRLEKRQRLVLASAAQSAMERLMQYISWTLQGYLTEEVQKNAKFTFEFWSVMSRNEQIAVKAKERYLVFFTDLAAILQQGISAGEFAGNLDVEAMVYLLLSTMDGIGFMNAVMGVPLTEETIRTYQNMIAKQVRNSL